MMAAEKESVILIFTTHYKIHDFKHHIGIVGHGPQLGSWGFDSAVSFIETPPGSATWVAAIKVSARAVLEFKCVILDQNNQVQVWETDGPNRNIVVAECTDAQAVFLPWGYSDKYELLSVLPDGTETILAKDNALLYPFTNYKKEEIVGSTFGNEENKKGLVSCEEIELQQNVNPGKNIHDYTEDNSPDKVFPSTEQTLIAPQYVTVNTEEICRNKKEKPPLKKSSCFWKICPCICRQTK